MWTSSFGERSLQKYNKTIEYRSPMTDFKTDILIRTFNGAEHLKVETLDCIIDNFLLKIGTEC